MIYYYKVFDTKGIFLGCISSLAFRKYQNKNRIMLNAREQDAECVEINNQYYISDAFVQNKNLDYPKVNFEPISKEEYDQIIK